MNDIQNQLIDLAKNGGDRPKQKDGKIGKLLTAYTCGATTIYSEEFDQTIRQLRPDWFRKPKHNAHNIKIELLKVAATVIPISTDIPYFNNFIHYRNKNSKSYDPDFVEQIRAINPSWLLPIFVNQRAYRKSRILEIAAIEGSPRPRLDNFVTRCMKGYDQTFVKQLREMRPDWFHDMQHVLVKRRYIDRLRSEPDQDTLYGFVGGHGVMSYYRYMDCDPDFRNTIREINPRMVPRKYR